MPLLPRSRRGTWLLAGVIWLAACAAWWCVLPVVPRGELKFPETSHFLGFVPDGKCAVVVNPIAESVLDRQLVDLDLVEVSSSNRLRTLLDHRPRVDMIGQSWNGRTMLLWQPSYPYGRFLKVDLSEFTVETQSLSDLELDDFFWPRLSPDGRFAVLPSRKNDPAVRIWDLIQNRMHGMLTGVRLPIGFAGASRPLLVAAEAGERANRVSIFDMETLSTLATFDGPDRTSVSAVGLSKSGQHLAAEFETENPKGHEFQLICWNVATRTVETRVANLRRDRAIVAGSRLLVMGDASHHYSLQCTELHFPSGKSLEAPQFCHSSPDYRLLLMEISGPVTSPLEKLAERIGLPWRGHPLVTGRLYETTTGSTLGAVRAKPAYAQSGMVFRLPMDLQWSPDGRSVALFDPESEGTWHIWDIPPRKSLPWFAAVAALFALPIALVARRRGRRRWAA